MEHLKGFTYEIILPSKDLKDFVSHFWYSRWNSGVQDHFSYHSTANTNTELVFAFSPANKYRMDPVFSTLQGHTTNYCCIESGGLSEMFGVSLYSYAIPYFFKVSASELVNQLVDLNTITYQDAAAITDRLANGRDFKERVDIMTQYLKSRFDTSRHGDLTIIDAIRRIREMHGQVNILKLAKESALSQKQFERRFKDFSGFNPKMYARVFRFESSLSLFNRTTNFTDKALDLGYYDQAHFINDFKKFSGFSPGKYVPVTSG